MMPETTRPADTLHSAFVTGATGYAGAFITAELLRRTPAIIHCLVRAHDAAEASSRLRSTFEAYEIWKEAYADRLVPVVGDLREPLLGLEGAEFTRLAGDVEAIYHSGAQVNFIFPYAALRRANVEGTQEVIRLAVRGRLTPLHHISSVDVLLRRGMVAVREDDSLPERPMLHGYVQSKWAAERVVLAARAKGLPVSIYRPWLIGAHTETGHCHTTDYVLRVLRACLEVRAFPDYDEEFNVCPVDFFSRALAHISLDHRWLGRSFHLANLEGATASTIHGWLRSFGYDLEVIAYDAWRALLMRELPPSSPAYPLLPLIPKEPPPEEARYPRIDCSTALAALEGTGIACPSLDEAYAHRGFAHLVRIGFLPAPGRHRGEAALRGGAETG